MLGFDTLSATLSPPAQERLKELRSMGIVEAALACMSDDFTSTLSSNPSENEILKKLIKNFGRGNDGYLFSEFTTVSDSEISSRVKRFMREGIIFDSHTYIIDTPFDWVGPENASRNHRYKIHAWVMLDEVLQDLSENHNQNYLFRCNQVALEWVEKFIFGDEVDEFAWYDMSVGQRSSLLSFLIKKSLIDSSKRNFFTGPSQQIKPLEILKLIICADVHLHELQFEGRIASHSNHGFFQMSGLLSICSELPFLKYSESGRVLAMQKIEQMLKHHFFEDGFHKEHSPMYHAFMANYLHQLQDSGWVNDSKSLLSLSNQSKKICNWYIMPDGFLVPIGDSNMCYRSDELCIFDLHRDSNDTPSSPAGLHIHEEGGLVISSHNNHLGKATEYLSFNAQFHSRQHKHADDLSIHYCVKGQQYLVDSGTFTYHYDEPERMYVESTRSHNTVEIDNLNFSRFKQDAFGSALSMAAKIGPCVVMEGIVEHTRLVSSQIPNNQVKTSDAVMLRTHSSKPGVIHRRMVIQVPEHLLVVLDFLESEHSHDYTQWFHLSPDFTVKEDESGNLAVISPQGQIHSTIHTIGIDDSEPCEIELIRGRKKPNLQGWFCRDGKELIPNQAIGIRKSATSTTFATIFDHSEHISKKPSINIGTKGKYFRFSMRYPNKQINLIIRENNDGIRQIEFNNDEEKFVEEIVPNHK